MNPPYSSEDAADSLREQAASYRRLSRCARTAAGSKALNTIADHFDDDAARIDPRTLPR